MEDPNYKEEIYKDNRSMDIEKNEDVYDLGIGKPGTHILHMMPQLMKKATAYRMKEEENTGANLFQYGVLEGDCKYRQSLAKFLSEVYEDKVDSSKLFLTAGATSGLWMVLTLMFKSGGIVFVEDPTYYFALTMFHDFGMKVIPVRMDKKGIIPEVFEEELKTHLGHEASLGLPLAALVYLVPIYHNPTGIVYDSERCKKLITLCRQFNILLICDDIYNVLHYDKSTSVPKRLFSYDSVSDQTYKGNVISNGEFSKILSPGLCLGWLEAPIWLVKVLKTKGAILSGGGLNAYTSGIISSAIDLGLVMENLIAIKQIYKESMNKVSDILHKELPEGCYLESPATGGCHLWIKLPNSVDAAQVKSFAEKKHKVSFALGNSSSATGSYKNFIRISIAFYEKDILSIAVKKLCEAIKSFLILNK